MLSNREGPLPEVVAERVYGLALDLAVGDDNGGPVEMALCLMQSLLNCRPKYCALDVGSRYLSWFRDPLNRHVVWDTGPTAAKVFRNSKVASDLPGQALILHRDLDGQTAGVNPVHRVAPLAIAAWLDPLQMQAAAWEEAGLTHHHDLARGCCVVLTVLCRRLILGDDWIGCLRVALGLPQLEPAAFAPLRAMLATSLAVAEDNVCTATGAVAARFNNVGNGGFCIEALGAALHFAVLAKSFADGLCESKSFAGPANYCPVLVGALLGARFGVHQVAAMTKTRSHTEEQYEALLRKLRALAEELAASWWQSSSEAETRNA